MRFCEARRNVANELGAPWLSRVELQRKINETCPHALDRLGLFGGVRPGVQVQSVQYGTRPVYACMTVGRFFGREGGEGRGGCLIFMEWGSGVEGGGGGASNRSSHSY